MTDTAVLGMAIGIPVAVLLIVLLVILLICCFCPAACACCACAACCGRRDKEDNRVMDLDSVQGDTSGLRLGLTLS